MRSYASAFSKRVDHRMNHDWNGLSDEELIKKYRQGETAVAEYLVNKYKPLVRKKARWLYLEGGDHEDLLQEGMVGLFKAMSQYRDDVGASFYTFADRCIGNQMYTAIEAASRKKHAALNESVYFSSMDEQDVLKSCGTVQGPETILLQQEEADDLKRDIIKRLSPMETKVFELYVEGNDYRQIAKLLGKSDKSIDNALSRIRMKIRK